MNSLGYRAKPRLWRLGDSAWTCCMAPPNLDIAAGEALATLGPSQLNTGRWADASLQPDCCSNEVLTPQP